MVMEKLVALVGLSSCVSWLLCCSSLGAMRYSAVCDCGISLSYSFTILNVRHLRYSYQSCF